MVPAGIGGAISNAVQGKLPYLPTRGSPAPSAQEQQIQQHLESEAHLADMAPAAVGMGLGVVSLMLMLGPIERGQ